jgi:hypothetical protein
MQGLKGSNSASAAELLLDVMNLKYLGLVKFHPLVDDFLYPIFL